MRLYSSDGKWWRNELKRHHFKVLWQKIDFENLEQRRIPEDGARGEDRQTNRKTKDEGAGRETRRRRDQLTSASEGFQNDAEEKCKSNAIEEARRTQTE